MTGVIVAITVAYVAVAALLLNLNLATRWGGVVKACAIVLVTVFYAVAWRGHLGLLGWATTAPLPDEFRLHWITIDEPDKATGADGTIFFWVRELDRAGLPRGAPRAHRVRWDEQTAEAAEEALVELEGGKPLNGRMSRQVVDPDARPPPVEGVDYRGDPTASASGGERPRFEFSRVPPPALPPKAVAE